MAKFTIKESEILTKEQRRKFVLLFGVDALEQATIRMGIKRLGRQEVIQEKARILENLHHTEQSKADRILAEMQRELEGTVPNMDKDIELEISVDDNKVSNSEYFHNKFLELFDDDRLLDVLKIKPEYREVSRNNYFSVQGAKPYQQGNILSR